MHRDGSPDFLFVMSPFHTVETKYNEDGTAMLYAVFFSGRLKYPAVLYFLCYAVLGSVFGCGYFNNIKLKYAK